MPPLVSVRTIIDRMKSMSNYLTISANYNGEFRLKIETESVLVETYFKDLMAPDLSKFLIIIKFIKIIFFFLISNKKKYHFYIIIKTLLKIHCPNKIDLKNNFRNVKFQLLISKNLFIVMS